MTRCFNFCAGPASLPESVLEIAREDMLDWHGKGLSVMEMSHRSTQFSEIFQETKSKFKALFSVPDTHEILFLQGGASLQFQ